MKTYYIFSLLLLCCSCSQVRSSYPDIVHSGKETVCLSSDDTMLVKIFDWALQNSAKYVGNENDPVGPWYEASLPGRSAFCIRDVSHQCIGEEINGHSRHNLNMFTKFVENISEAKDWCSFWEINSSNLPAPVDYTSDKDFWYNLNANFDIINACYRLYEWTGNKTYLQGPAFDRFFRLSLNEYVDRWQLQADRIMKRSGLMNMPEPIPDTMRFKYARGLPSYEESVEGLKVTGDLIAVIYKGFKAFADMQDILGNKELSSEYAAKAEEYRALYDSVWWNAKENKYYAYYLEGDRFKQGGNNMFIPWYGLATKPERIAAILKEASEADTNVESMSYYPMTFYKHGQAEIAYRYLQGLYTNDRRDYPEAASGTIEGIVCGLVGMEPSASANRVMTCPRLTSATKWVALENVPVFSGLVSVLHQSACKTSFINKSDKEIIWRAAFAGHKQVIRSGGVNREVKHYTDALGNRYSYADIVSAPGELVMAEASMD